MVTLSAVRVRDASKGLVPKVRTSQSRSDVRIIDVVHQTVQCARLARLGVASKRLRISNTF